MCPWVRVGMETDGTCPHQHLSLKGTLTAPELGLLRESQRDGNGAFGGTSRKLLLLMQDWEEIEVSATIYLSHLGHPEFRELRNFFFF